MPKWVHIASSLAVTLAGSLMAFDWGSLSPHSAGAIVMGLGFVKTLATALAAPDR